MFRAVTGFAQCASCGNNGASWMTAAHEVNPSSPSDARHRGDASEHVMHTVCEDGVVVAQRVAGSFALLCHRALGKVGSEQVKRQYSEPCGHQRLPGRRELQLLSSR